MPCRKMSRPTLFFVLTAFAAANAFNLGHVSALTVRQPSILRAGKPVASMEGMATDFTATTMQL
jgi:hypothetical protein